MRYPGEYVYMRYYSVNLYCFDVRGQRATVLVAFLLAPRPRDSRTPARCDEVPVHTNCCIEIKVQ